MYLDPYEKVIYVRANDVPRSELGLRTFELSLADKSGLSSQYLLNIDFYEDIWVPPELLAPGLE